MSDPIEVWRATVAATGQSASAQLRETQAALAAMQARYEEARHEAKEWRAEAERYLGTLQEVATDLCATKYQNRRLQAELDSALGALNDTTHPDTKEN